MLAVTNYAIAREERYLEQLFGQKYLDYKQRVRRWF
jgi:protein-S-isoprenylcysteine O-methyltransferase Ste14